MKYAVAVVKVGCQETIPKLGEFFAELRRRHLETRSVIKGRFNWHTSGVSPCSKNDHIVAYLCVGDNAIEGTLAAAREPFANDGFVGTKECSCNITDTIFVPETAAEQAQLLYHFWPEFKFLGDPF